MPQNEWLKSDSSPQLCIAVWWIRIHSRLCVFVWQMRARQCVPHLPTCKVTVWVRWASSFGRYVTRRWTPGTTFSSLSSALSSSPPGQCLRGWWASSWCSTSATSRRKTISSNWRMRTKGLRRVARREAEWSGVTAALIFHILFERILAILSTMDSHSASCTPPRLSVDSDKKWKSFHQAWLSTRKWNSTEMRNVSLITCTGLSGDDTCFWSLCWKSLLLGNI